MPTPCVTRGRHALHQHRRVRQRHPQQLPRPMGHVHGLQGRLQLLLRCGLRGRRRQLLRAAALAAALAAAALATPSHPAAISPAAARRGGGGCTQGGRVDRGGCGGSRGSCVGGGSTLKITRMCDVTSPCCCRLGLCSVSARRFSQPAILGGFTFSREALRQTVLPKKGANSGS